eukprot:g9418.t1
MHSSKVLSVKYSGPSNKFVAKTVQLSLRTAGARECCCGRKCGRFSVRSRVPHGGMASTVSPGFSCNVGQEAASCPQGSQGARLTRSAFITGTFVAGSRDYALIQPDVRSSIDSPRYEDYLKNLPLEAD